MISRREFIKRTAASASLIAALNNGAFGENSSGASLFETAAANDSPFGALLRDSHDLDLPAWGPYTKTYNGISHIADAKQGFRFDLSVMPAFYRRKILIPNVRWESGYHLWEAASNFDYVAFRYELEWKDRVFADVSFSKIDERARLARCEFVNNTNVNQTIALHLVASINFPVLPRTDRALRPAIVKLPSGAVWVDSNDFADFRRARPRPTDNLVYDGYRRGEVRDVGFVNSSGIRLGANAGDALVFKFDLPAPVERAALVARYRFAPDAARKSIKFELRGSLLENQTGAAEIVFDDAAQNTRQTKETANFFVKTIELNRVAAGAHELSFVSAGGAEVDFDGFAVVPAEKQSELFFSLADWSYQPKIEQAGERAVILKYKDIEHFYGLSWNASDFETREFVTDDFDFLFNYNTHDHVRRTISDGGEHHYTDVFIRPLALAPHSRRSVYAVVADNASREELAAQLENFDFNETNCRRIVAEARESVEKIDSTDAGKVYEFGQRLMRATVATNAVFPVYTRKQFVKHYTPGRWWADFLYTWDAGFIGLGLAEINLARAVDVLNAYTTAPGDREAAFIHHGSPVPVQIYLFQEIWNRTQDREFLARFYPRVQQYHQFLAGRLGSSTTRKFKSNLLVTWDYFYNSGGWDDYPPQKFVHDNKLTASVAPVINTAQAIRTAKILRQAARILNLPESETKQYDRDIQIFTDALQTHSWDAHAGYFSYVTHDAEGKPNGFLRHSSGANFNSGMDGAYPLVAGICTDEQKRILVARLKDQNRLLTDIGLSTVDRSAPYFTPEGYWNGAVWMPHQWFFWKTLLDLGEGDFAFQIAKKALDLWRRETAETYNCFEHFVVQSGRGAGWHQFGALSSPVLSWFAAYFQPGRITTGFDAFVLSANFTNDNRAANARLRFEPTAENALSSSTQANVLATMNPRRKYQAKWNGRSTQAAEISPGAWQIVVPANAGEGVLDIAERK